jgi:hypothetical protein
MSKKLAAKDKDDNAEQLLQDGTSWDVTTWWIKDIEMAIQS